MARHHQQMPQAERWLLGQLIRLARTARGLTQQDLATRSGLSRANIQRLEQGIGTPTLAALTQLATVLGLEALRDLCTRQAALAEVTAYLQQYPDQAEALGAVVRWARRTGFTQWESLTPI
jgi:transcriptional regulator with XRE-family HTH domain